MLRNIVGWYVSLGAKMFYIAPINTVTVVILTLVSQLSLLLTFFLPLKVIILLGSNGIPHYYPESWHSLGHSKLVVALSCAAGVFYLLYGVAEHTIKFCAERGAKRMLEKSQKITLFHDQEEISSRAYQRYVQSLASLIFIFFAITGLSFYFPSLAALLVTYCIATYVAASQLYKHNHWFKKKIDSGIGGTAKVLTSIGFLLAFVWITFALLQDIHKGKMIAIVALILSRQTMQRLSTIILDFANLLQQKPQISALFFHGHVLKTDKPLANKGFWSLLEHRRRQAWLQTLIHELLGDHYSIQDTAWHQTGANDVFAFKVITHNGQKNSEELFLVKIYASHRRELAMQEATLLASKNAKTLPTPEFLGATHLDNYHCHIFAWQDARKSIPKEVKPGGMEISTSLMAFTPPPALVSRYCRSRPLLWQRLDSTVIDRLRLGSQSEGAQQIVDRFSEYLPKIEKNLEALPLQIVNPDVNVDTLQQFSDGNFALCHWGRWSLEPIGAGWPILETDLQRLVERFEDIRCKRSEFSNVHVQHIVLCALLYALERLLQRQQFASAFNMLPDILEKLEAQAEVPIPA
ncbi:hypothetical protein [Pseudomonas putida]|uniref:hypothetical protein n=1 Tax=Pseudomonas putida TaxID=303 RepID=UPI0038067152